jgi:hypothetical protein
VLMQELQNSLRPARLRIMVNGESHLHPGQVTNDTPPFGEEFSFAEKTGCLSSDAIESPSVLMKSLPEDDKKRNRGLLIEPGNLELSYRLLCVCGYKLHCEVMYYGERLGELVFFDDDETSKTRGKRIWYCSGCNERLDLLGLR